MCYLGSVLRCRFLKNIINCLIAHIRESLIHTLNSHKHMIMINNDHFKQKQSQTCYICEITIMMINANFVKKTSKPVIAWKSFAD